MPPRRRRGREHGRGRREAGSPGLHPAQPRHGRRPVQHHLLGPGRGDGTPALPAGSRHLRHRVQQLELPTGGSEGSFWSGDPVRLTRRQPLHHRAVAFPAAQQRDRDRPKITAAVASWWARGAGPRAGSASAKRSTAGGNGERPKTDLATACRGRAAPRPPCPRAPPHARRAARPPSSTPITARPARPSGTATLHDTRGRRPNLPQCGAASRAKCDATPRSERRHAGARTAAPITRTGQHVVGDQHAAQPYRRHGRPQHATRHCLVAFPPCWTDDSSGTTRKP